MRLGEVGHWDTALRAIEEAVELRKELAAGQPGEPSPDLAGSLDALGICLSRARRFDEALAVTREAVDLRRRLAADRPDAFLEALAGSLTNLGCRFAATRRRKAALQATREAVHLFRQLAGNRPEAFSLRLAQALNNLANQLFFQARIDDAVKAAEESVSIRRELAAGALDIRADLARGLHTLGLCLAHAGSSRQREALATTRESIEIQRPLWREHPAEFQPRLARSLYSLSSLLLETGDPRGALEAAEEALHILQPAVERQPVAHASLLEGIVKARRRAAEAADLSRP